MGRFKGTLSIGFPTAERHFYFEIDDEEFEGMSHEERESLIDSRTWETIKENGYIEYYAEEAN